MASGASQGAANVQDASSTASLPAERNCSMTTEPKVELSPCPKCQSDNVGLDQFSVNRNRFVGECRDCDYMTATCETADEAAAAWNARPTPAAELGDVEKVARAMDPALWSDDEETAHMAASPLQVCYAREWSIKNAEQFLVEYSALSPSPAPEASESEEEDPDARPTSKWILDRVAMFRAALSHSTPAELPGDALREADKRSFNAGYLIAVANIMNLHHEDVIAKDVLRELGCTKLEMERLDLADYDLKPLRELYSALTTKENG